MPGQVSSTALVRYRLVDYSAPAVHAHKKVTVKGYVDRVEIALDAEIIARDRRSYVHGDVVYDPLHYLSLLEKKPGALDQAPPLRGWKLDPAFDKQLESFDFKAIPSLNKMLVLDLARGDYIERRENAILLGPSGVGKTYVDAPCSASRNLNSL